VGSGRWGKCDRIYLGIWLCRVGWLRSCLFQLFSCLFQLKSKKLKQTTKIKINFWNIENHAFEEVKKLKSLFRAAFQIFNVQRSNI
jgi:hypothetical protein